jgi:hypothetical protein
MLAEGNLSSPDVLFVFPATVEEGADFFNEFWPEARGVSDPNGHLYQGMGVSKASLREMFGPGVWLRFLKAKRKGHSVGKVVGNPWLLPGLFLVHKGEICWSWRCRNIADHPDFSAIPGLKESDE